MVGYLTKLVDHLEWADAATLRALENAPESDGRALTVYAHVVGAEAVWLARIAGRPQDVAVWPTLSLDESRTVGARNVAELKAVLRAADQAAIEREIEYRNSAGQSFRSKVEDILLHVCLHGAYHRGQIAQMIRQGGGEPAPTDFIAFIRGVPAAKTIPPAQVAQPR
jgi:uncharacterized damage-inducible protein DinB